MIDWLTGRRRRLQELRSVCELALSHLDFHFQVKVHVARLCDASEPDWRYLVLLDTTDHIQPAAMLSLRSYLSASIRSSLDWQIEPERLVVVAMDSKQAANAADRISREDVLASRLRANGLGPSIYGPSHVVKSLKW